MYLAPSSQQAALLHVMRYFERENGNWDRIKEAEVEISLVKDLNRPGFRGGLLA